MFDHLIRDDQVEARVYEWKALALDVQALDGNALLLGVRRVGNVALDPVKLQDGRGRAPDPQQVAPKTRAYVKHAAGSRRASQVIRRPARDDLAPVVQLFGTALEPPQIADEGAQHVNAHCGH
jgi:hypothetical protein